MRIKSNKVLMSVCKISGSRVIIDADVDPALVNDPRSIVALSERSILNAVDVGDCITYKITQTDADENIINQETGIGTVKKDGKFVVLSRDNPRTKVQDGQPNTIKPGKPGCNFPNGAIVALTMEKCRIKHDNCLDLGNQCFMLQPNTFLYVDEKVNVHALSPEQVKEKLKDEVEKDINVDTITINKTTRPLKPKDGMFIWNPRTGNLEFYNGDDWVSLT